jgi:putative hydrolase of the HAD superfamily
MIKLIVFDLGETLINYKSVPLNWSSHYSKALEYAFECSRIPFTNKLIDDASSILLKYNTRVNPRRKEISAEVIFEEILNEIEQENKKYFMEKFFEYFQRETEIENTALDLLPFLKADGIKTAVLTDVPYGMPKKIVQKDLTALYGYLDLVLTSVEVEFRKPETIGLEIIMNKFNANETETIYVGNEKKDMELANAIGVFSVLLKGSGETPDWEQKKTISKLLEIKLLLHKDNL